MAFQVIHTAPDLSERERRRAHQSGPWAVSSPHAPDELIRRAGFVDIDLIDQTDQFRRTGAAWIREWDSHRDELVALYGQAEFDTRQEERNVQQQATDDGLLVRSLVVGRRPGASSGGGIDGRAGTARRPDVAPRSGEEPARFLG